GLCGEDAVPRLHGQAVGEVEAPAGVELEHAAAAAEAEAGDLTLDTEPPGVAPAHDTDHRLRLAQRVRLPLLVGGRDERPVHVEHPRADDAAEEAAESLYEVELDVRGVVGPLHRGHDSVARYEQALPELERVRSGGDVPVVIEPRVGAAELLPRLELDLGPGLEGTVLLEGEVVVEVHDRAVRVPRRLQHVAREVRPPLPILEPEAIVFLARQALTARPRPSAQLGERPRGQG